MISKGIKRNFRLGDGRNTRQTLKFLWQCRSIYYNTQSQSLQSFDGLIFASLKLCVLPQYHPIPALKNEDERKEVKKYLIFRAISRMWIKAAYGYLCQRNEKKINNHNFFLHLHLLQGLRSAYKMPAWWFDIESSGYTPFTNEKKMRWEYKIRRKIFSQRTIGIIWVGYMHTCNCENGESYWHFLIIYRNISGCGAFICECLKFCMSLFIKYFFYGLWPYILRFHSR